jgi:hypothetical protein
MPVVRSCGGAVASFRGRPSAVAVAVAVNDHVNDHVNVNVDDGGGSLSMASGAFGAPSS